METNKRIIGILAGVAIGAIVGILVAPDKGANTRSKIIKKGASATDGLKAKLDAITNSVSEKYNSLKNKSEDFVAKGKDQIRA